MSLVNFAGWVSNSGPPVELFETSVHKAKSLNDPKTSVNVFDKKMLVLHLFYDDHRHRQPTLKSHFPPNDVIFCKALISRTEPICAHNLCTFKSPSWSCNTSPNISSPNSTRG